MTAAAAGRMNANSSDKLTTETNTKEPQITEPKLAKLTERELDMVTAVFKSFETGLREGTMFPKVGLLFTDQLTPEYMQDLHPAMKMLGLNPLEQEILDLTNEIARNGFIYFPEFCRIVTAKYREEDEEVFRQNMFKVFTLLNSVPIIT